MAVPAQTQFLDLKRETGEQSQPNESRAVPGLLYGNSPFDPPGGMRARALFATLNIYCYLSITSFFFLPSPIFSTPECTCKVHRQTLFVMQEKQKCPQDRKSGLIRNAMFVGMLPVFCQPSGFHFLPSSQQSDLDDVSWIASPISLWRCDIFFFFYYSFFNSFFVYLSVSFARPSRQFIPANKQTLLQPYR